MFRWSALAVIAIAACSARTPAPNAPAAPSSACIAKPEIHALPSTGKVGADLTIRYQRWRAEMQRASCDGSTDKVPQMDFHAVAQVFIVKGDAFSIPEDVQLTLGFDSGSTVSGQLALRDLPRLVREASFVEIDAEPMVHVDRTETAP